jgi:capsular exopolysaccharide synthesis family protein
MNREIITNNDPKSPVSEIFRTLRTNIQYMKRKDNTQSILITSTVQGEGKSFIASNLAVTFAQAGKNTIIIDADMRRPRQNKAFETQMYPGLSNYLSGVDLDRMKRKLKFEDCIYQTQVENLWIMPSGNIPPNPSELLQSSKFSDLVKELEEKFEIIIFDGAPCLAVTDSMIISRLVDHTVLVCAQNFTKIDDLKQVKKLINQVGGNIAGVVINKAKFSKKRLEYSYYVSNNGLISSKSRHQKDDYLNFKTSHEKSENVKNRGTHKSATIKYNNVNWACNDSKKTIDETYKKNNEKSNDKDNAISKNAGESNKKLDSQNKDVGNSDNTEDKSSDKINEILKQIKEMKDSSK